MDEQNQNIESQPTEPKDGGGSRPSPNPNRRTMLIRYGQMGYVGEFRHNEKEIPPLARYVVIKTERGLELGEIISPFFHHRGRFSMSSDKIESYCSRSGPDYPLSQSGKVVRFATDQDLNEQKHLENNSHKELEYCQQLIDEMKLPMKLVSCEHLFGGDRIIFYFMADGRVDFRNLVKQLAQQYQTRIEMRQVGARDEARLVGDIETCGRECCCKNFLKVLNPVNMRMAKVQKATLDPSKISGTCGRLKCCLRYEDDVYTEHQKRLPRRNTCVLTNEGPGTVIDTEILSQQVRVSLDKGTMITIGVDEIKDFNYKRPPSEAEATSSQQSPSRSVKVQSDDSAKDASRSTKTPERSDQPASGGRTEVGSEPSEKKKRRRRRRRKKKPQNTQDGGSSPDQPNTNTNSPNE